MKRDEINWENINFGSDESQLTMHAENNHLFITTYFTVSENVSLQD